MSLETVIELHALAWLALNAATLAGLTVHYHAEKALT